MSTTIEPLILEREITDGICILTPEEAKMKIQASFQRQRQASMKLAF